MQGNNQQAALEWLFSLDGDVSAFLHLLESEKPLPSAAQGEKASHTVYQLRGVVIHLGKSVHSGHYVAYVKHGEEWILFNDEKVTLATSPVLGKGYVYLYEGV